MQLISEWGHIAGLAGLGLGLFVLLFREIIRKSIFANLTKKQSFNLLLVILTLIWSISIFSIYISSRDSKPLFDCVAQVDFSSVEIDNSTKNRWEIILVIGGYKAKESIDMDGFVRFENIPFEYKTESCNARFVLNDPLGFDYRFQYPDSAYCLDDDRILLLFPQLNGLDVLKGQVKDAASNEGIEDVLVSVMESADSTDKFGYYEVNISPENQQQYQTVNASKMGYLNYTIHNIPIIQGRPHMIQLRTE